MNVTLAMRADKEMAVRLEDSCELLHPSNLKRLGQMREYRKGVHEIELRIAILERRGQAVDREIPKRQIFAAPLDQLRVVVGAANPRLGQRVPVPQDTTAPAPEIKHRAKVLNLDSLSLQGVPDGGSPHGARIEEPGDVGRSSDEKDQI